MSDKVTDKVTDKTSTVQALDESTAASAESGRVDTAVFRVPGIAVLAVGLFMVCVTPIAGVTPWLLSIYLLPLGYLAWIVRTRTVASAEHITVRTLFGSTTLTWPELSGLAITKRAAVRAVLTDGSQIRLPSVRARHLPLLSLVSGGRITDPTQQAATGEQKES